MSHKKHLGRGLSTLIQNGFSQTSPQTSPLLPQENVLSNEALKASTELSFCHDFVELPIHTIAPNPHQPRKQIDPSKLQELAQNIHSEGLLQPIVVRKLHDQSYQLIAGERRLQACKLLSKTTIPARIISADDSTSAILSLVENLQREQLDPIEEAVAFKTFLHDFQISQEALAQRIGKDRSSIANSIRLLNLPQEIQSLIASSKLSPGHAKLLLSLDSPQIQLETAQKIINENFSVRSTEAYLQRIKAPQIQQPLPTDAQNAFKFIEHKIGQKLKTPVTLKPSAQGGRIIIDFSGQDELQRILKTIGVS